MIRTYSKHAAALSKASTHFKVTEFACNDGSDKILIDDKLVELLEFIRGYFNKPVTITSAYRTASYNKRVGGAANSQHTKGTAADIVVKDVDPTEVVKAAELFLGSSGGIGLYTISKFTHVDTRANQSRWHEIKRGKTATRGRFEVAKKEEEMIKPEKRTIIIDGKTEEVDGVFVGGINYGSIRQIAQKLGYNVSNKGSIPILTKK